MPPPPHPASTSSIAFALNQSRDTIPGNTLSRPPHSTLLHRRPLARSTLLHLYSTLTASIAAAISSRFPHSPLSDAFLKCHVTGSKQKRWMRWTRQKERKHAAAARCGREDAARGACSVEAGAGSRIIPTRLTAAGNLAQSLSRQTEEGRVRERRLRRRWRR